GSIVGNHEHKVGVREGLVRLLDTDRLHLIGVAANPRRVDEPNGNTSNRNHFRNQVACSARNGSDDGTLTLHETVEQTRLADVRTADDRQHQSLMHYAAICKRSCEGFERWSDLSGGRENPIVWKHRDIVLRKVDTCFKQCDEFYQLLLDGFDAAGKRAFELLRSSL